MSTDAEPLDFEHALKGLERAVDALERGDLDLADALAAFEEGIRRLGQCQALLDGAERKVALLTGTTENGTLQTVPFDATATAELEPQPTPKPRRSRRVPPADDPPPAHPTPDASPTR
jgi:exodeoxyribonuclease VII small subunit